MLLSAPQTQDPHAKTSVEFLTWFSSHEVKVGKYLKTQKKRVQDHKWDSEAKPSYRVQEMLVTDSMSHCIVHTATFSSLSPCTAFHEEISTWSSKIQGSYAGKSHTSGRA